MPSGMSSAGHEHLDRVAHDVERAAALEARRRLSVDEVHRHVDADCWPAFRRRKSTWSGEVLHRIELVVARKDAGLLAVDVDLELRGEEVAGEDELVAPSCSRAKWRLGLRRRRR